MFLSYSQNIGEDAVKLLWCRRLEEVLQQREQGGLDRLLLIRQRAAIFLHTTTKDRGEK